MYDIQFHNQQTPFPHTAPGRCYMCNHSGYTPVLQVKAGKYLPRDLDLVECTSCHTMYYFGGDTVVGYNHESFERDYWYNYVQNGAGITAMLEPLLAVSGIAKTDLLDVGCGFGFVPHFWQQMGFGDAVGLETSYYGRVGAEKLGIRIIDSYYSTATEISDRKFGFVFSSEVLEHVPDPLSFIVEISAGLKPDGILVLTTPCADDLRKETSLSDLGAILSPGFHFFITRQAALETLLGRAGFSNIKVQNLGNRLFAWASHAPLPAIRYGFDQWETYFEYLEELSRNPDPHVSGGALYRILKDSINVGKLDWSRKVYPAFSAVAREAYQIDFNNPAASVERRNGRTAPDYQQFPSWMGCGFLYAGRLQEIQNSDIRLQVDLYQAAVETMKVEVELGAQFAQEPAHFLPAAQEYLASAGDRLRDYRLKQVAPSTVSVIDRPLTAMVSGQEVCLFVSYAPDGKLLPGTVALMKAIQSEGIAIVLCLAVDDPAEPLDLAGLDDAIAVLRRRNGGFDFAIWAAALESFPQLWDVGRLYFVNDSILGPMRGFGNMIQRIRNSPASYIALTESFQQGHHTQSYFFVLRDLGLQSPVVRRFWQRIETLVSKDAVISAYETAFLSMVKNETTLLIEVLFSFEVLSNGYGIRGVEVLNPTHQLWEHLIHKGFPFIKTELLYRNPMGLPLHHWEAVVASYGGDIQLIRDHLDALALQRHGTTVERSLYRKWRRVRRAIGDDAFFSARDWIADKRKKRKRRKQ